MSETVVPKLDPREVAQIRNGVVYSVLAVQNGMVYCLEKQKDNAAKHCRVHSLLELASRIKATDVLLPEDPNVDKPELTRRINMSDFRKSHEDFRTTGTTRVKHIVPPRLATQDA